MTETLSEGLPEQEQIDIGRKFSLNTFQKKIVADDKCQSGAIYAVLRQLFGISPPRVRKLLRLTLAPIKNAKVVGSFFHKHCQRHNEPRLHKSSCIIFVKFSHLDHLPHFLGLLFARVAIFIS